MSWKKLNQNVDNHKYTANLTGTPKEWSKKLKDIESQGHEIISQGVLPYTGHMSFDKGHVNKYWARVARPI